MLRKDFSLKFDPFNLLPALRNMENSNLKHYAACLAFLLQCFVLTACQTQKPVYDDTLGLTAIPVEPGALAGRFYLRGVTNHLADLSFLGTWESASEVFWLVERSYDEVTQSYSQVMVFAQPLILNLGVTSTIPAMAYERVETAEVRRPTITRPELMKPMIFSSLLRYNLKTYPCRTAEQSRRTG